APQDEKTVVAVLADLGSRQDAGARLGGAEHGGRSPFTGGTGNERFNGRSFNTFIRMTGIMICRPAVKRLVGETGLVNRPDLSQPRCCLPAVMVDCHPLRSSILGPSEVVARGIA